MAAYEEHHPILWSHRSITDFRLWFGPCVQTHLAFPISEEMECFWQENCELYLAIRLIEEYQRGQEQLLQFEFLKN
jgi:hypothetical protein